MDVDLEDAGDAPALEMEATVFRVTSTAEGASPVRDSVQIVQMSATGAEIPGRDLSVGAVDSPECDEEGDPFPLADGSELAFSEWRRGLVPDDRIRNQLKSLLTGWERAKISEALEATVLAQKLTLRWAAMLNRSLPEKLQVGLMSCAPTEVGNVARVLKKLVADAIDEAVSRVNNIIRTETQFPRVQPRVGEALDEEDAKR